MKGISYSILLQHEETGSIVEKIYSYADIFSGRAKTEVNSLTQYCVLTRRNSTGNIGRNGKEIYEEDIVLTALDWDDESYGREKFVVRYGMGEMDSGVYTYPGFYLESLDGKQADFTGWKRSHEVLQVIGNIYEHPYLLSSENK